jgi:TetR/AcrR family transcriptional regulator, regulator of cefoperazone and chloramphenicol sensitivity
MSRLDHPTRERILCAAEPLFAERGFSGVTMRAIAKAAGVHLGQLPYYFGTKDALYTAIWQHWGSRLAARTLIAELNSGSSDPAEDRLRNLVCAFFEGPRRMLQDERGKHFVAIMVREAHDPSGSSRRVLTDFIYPNARIFRGELASLFPEMASDAVDAGFAMIVSALRVVIEPDQSEANVQPDSIHSERQFDLLTDFVVQGWLALHDRNQMH